MPTDAIVLQLCDRRLAFMQTLSNWSENEKGWTARVARVRTDAITMVHGVNIQPKPMMVAPGDKAIGAVRVTATPSGKSAIATVIAVLASAGLAAGQAETALQPYTDIGWVRLIVVGLALLSSASSLVVAAQRAANGSTK